MGAGRPLGRLGGLLDRPAEPDRTIPTASQLLQAPGPAMSSSKSGFKAKLDNFQQRFKSLLGAKAQVGRPDLWLGADRSPLTSLPRPPCLGFTGAQRPQLLRPAAGRARAVDGCRASNRGRCRRRQLPPPSASRRRQHAACGTSPWLGARSRCAPPPPQGYDELNTLERPLVSDVHEQEEYERAHGVAAPGAGTYGGGYAPPAATSGYAPPGYTPAAAYGAQPVRHGAGLPAPPSQVGGLGGWAFVSWLVAPCTCQHTRIGCAVLRSWSVDPPGHR